MVGDSMKSFLVSHPKLFELAFAGAVALPLIGAQLNGVTGNAGP
ncbi:hypothetical protein ACFPYI_18445 [Halomarina salina]|uniref:Uncharacterized protein n=1 Tax=Halomarina salina TaxID=1872699 RepID=A0ABD5RSJ2_9EURY|nr:hypothetical protein [Halomarina salina]